MQVTFSTAARAFLAGGTRPRPQAETETAEPVDRIDLGERLRETAREAASLAPKLAPHVEGQVLVKLRPGTLPDDTLLEDYRASLLHRFDVPDHFGGELVQLRLPPDVSTAQAIAAMGTDERIAYACANDVLERLGEADPVIPDDLDSRLWGLHNQGQNDGRADADIDAPEAWRFSTGSRENGPVIAVIDTGVDYRHPDLANNIWTNPHEIPGDGIDNDGNGIVDDVHGYNAINGSGNPMDDNMHGTHCAGTIGAEGNNGKGVVGVNHQARMMAVKFLGSNGSGTTADAVKAVLYAGRMGARITSNSWGGGGYNQALKDALSSSPALHIFAAGNANSNNDRRPSYPASYDLPNIVSVAASDRRDQRASFSNYGATSVDLAAPGKEIFSTLPNGRYGTLSGTSMATPHVAGVAGLIATVYPEATNEEIKHRLLTGADPQPAFRGLTVSGGRLNAANSLETDETAPAAPNDFGVGEVTARSVTLNWTASGDDGWCGQARGYELRVADRPIGDGEGELPFHEARLVETPLASATGTIESATMRLIPSGRERPLHFALKVYDNVGNLSEIRTTSATVPSSAVAFEDTMDGERTSWTADRPFVRVTEGERGLVWSDSPEGNYRNDTDASLTSPWMSLEGLRNTSLIYDARYEVEEGYDYLTIEASTDGRDWIPVERLTGRGDWATRVVDLSRFDGQEIQLRFHLKTDASVVRDGFTLDRVVVTGDRSTEGCSG